jgi:hypothetical protein
LSLPEYGVQDQLIHGNAVLAMMFWQRRQRACAGAAQNDKVLLSKAQKVCAMAARTTTFALCIHRLMVTLSVCGVRFVHVHVPHPHNSQSWKFTRADAWLYRPETMTLCCV